MNFIKKLIHNSFLKHITIPKWRMHFLGVFMFAAGIAFSITYLTNEFVLPNLFAATSPWTQTDWSSGAASGTVSGTVTTYSAASNIDTSVAGKVSIALDSNEFTNSSVNSDSDLDSWLGTAPSSVSNLEIWLDASADVYSDAGTTLATDVDLVRQWNDQSGNTRNAYQTTGSAQPMYIESSINGRPAIDFDGNDHLLTPNIINGTGARSVMIVAQPDTYVGTYGGSLIDLASSGSGSGAYYSITIETAVRVSGNRVYNEAVPIGSTSLVTIKNGAGEKAGDIHGYIDGTELTQSSAASNTLNTANSTAIIGWAGQTVIERFDGKIAELLVYSSELSSTEQDALENYLGNKYAADGHTLTIDTDTKYSGAGSIKAVSPSDDTIELLQSVNVGDTDTYILEAYAYTDGSAVTSSDVQLYHDGSTVSTTYTSVGSGWYRLSGTITGSASSVASGVQVKANKTVYIDELSLKEYVSLATLTSNILDAEYAADWGTLTYTTSGSGTVSVKVRTDSNSDMSGATDWGSCTAVTSGDDLSSNGCVTDTHQYIQYQVSMNPGTGTTPSFEEISIAFTASDQVAPDTNATSVAITGIADGAWTNTEPIITWTAGVDNAGGAGLLGYCISLDEVSPGSSDGLDPELSSDTLTGIDDGVSNAACPYIVTTTSVDLSAISGLTLTTGKQYYFSIKAVDIAGNVYAGATGTYQDLVSFKYDAVKPTNPSFMSMPSDFIATKEATLTWPTSGSNAPADSDSGLAGLQYRIGSSGAWYGDDHTDGGNDDTDLLTNDGVYTFISNPDFGNLAEGNNLIYLRTWDNAGNVSATYVSGVLKVNTVAPGVPESLSVTPSDATTNSYTFSWDAPTTYTGSVSNITYCYTINSLPTASTCTYTSAGQTSLSAGAYATQPGTNTMYIVARDEANNVNYDTYASVEFEYSGSAPGIPQSVDIADISIKAQSDWKLAISWSEPSDAGAGISSYKVYRSTTATSCSSNFDSFTSIGNTAGTSYTDTGLAQATYYYCVKACDSANNCGAISSTVSLYPDGKFTTAADLTAGPTVTGITTKKATITWSTDRTSDSKVAYGTSSGNYNSEEVSNSSQSTSHTINLTNLEAGKSYFYKAKWTDEDGNTGLSEEKSFTTEPAPSVKEALISNVSISSGLLTFTASDATKAKIYYGPTTTFGGLSEISTSTTETTYTIPLTGLEDNTKYFYKINLLDSEGDEYEGDINSFTTLPRPRISSVRVQEVPQAANPTVLVTWTANTDVSSIVTYYPEGNPSEAQDVVDVARKSGTHRMLLKGLLTNQRYVLIAKGVDKAGNEAVSDTQTFTTSTDTRPPVITDLNIEGNIQSVTQSEDSKTVQLIVSWNTDEPSTSQVEFGEGTGSTYSQQTQEDKNLSFNHIVIISGLTPSKVYHIRVISRDQGGNAGKSIDVVTIAPKITDDALDLVLSNLRETFGFLDTFIK